MTDGGIQSTLSGLALGKRLSGDGTECHVKTMVASKCNCRCGFLLRTVLLTTWFTSFSLVPISSNHSKVSSRLEPKTLVRYRNWHCDKKVWLFFLMWDTGSTWYLERKEKDANDLEGPAPDYVICSAPNAIPAALTVAGRSSNAYLGKFLHYFSILRRFLINLLVQCMLAFRTSRFSTLIKSYCLPTKPMLS